MENFNCLIFEKSFLIRFALKNLISQHSQSITVYEYDGIENYVSKLKKHRPFCVFMGEFDEDDKTLFDILNTISEKGIAIGIQTSNIAPPAFSACDEVIFFSDEEDKVKKIIQRITKSTNEKAENKDGITKREEEVIACVASGMTNNEIGEKLFLSLHTIKTHRKNISKKLGIHSVSGLTVYAIMNNLISLEDAHSNNTTT